MNANIKESEILEIYNKLQQEQLRLMNELKNETMVDDRDIQKQITSLNTLTLGLLRFRNLQKSIEKKKDN